MVWIGNSEVILGGCLLSLFDVVSDRCNGTIHGEKPVRSKKIVYRVDFSSLDLFIRYWR